MIKDGQCSRCGRLIIKGFDWYFCPRCGINLNND